MILWAVLHGLVLVHAVSDRRLSPIHATAPLNDLIIHTLRTNQPVDAWDGEVQPSVRAVARLVASLSPPITEMVEIASTTQRSASPHRRREVRRLADDPDNRGPYVKHIHRMRFAQHKHRAKAKGIWSKLADRINEFFDRPFTGIDVQDCVCCRYIWLQVEMDLGSTSDPSALYDAFTHNCIEAQKVPMFMSGCSDMYESINDMIRDYGKDYTVDQLCQNSEICR